MARKKRYSGHYCKVCGEILPNERFSGKGHAAHICKKCAREPLKERQEDIAISRIGHAYMHPNLSRQNRLMLERYAHSDSDRVRQAAVDALAGFSGGFAPNGTEDRDGADDDEWDVTDSEAWDGIDDEIPF